MLLPKKSESSNRPSIPSVKDKLLGKIEDTYRPVDTNPWLDDPLGYKEFFASNDHMAFPWLSPKQLEFCSNGLTEDPKRTFDPDSKLVDILVAMWGKGGGKDHIASLITCYLVYILLHMKDPFGNVYGVPVPGEPIDIVIVAPRGRTSEKVTFEKLVQKVKHWKWLRDQYKIYESGREILAKDRTNSADDTVEIGANTIVFPHNIRVFALNSSVESAEGFNLLVFICTEFAGFINSDEKPNAEKIFRTLYSSAKTRFAKKFLGILISYPRYKGDAITVKYKESLDRVTNPRMYGMKATTWEANPMRSQEDFADELNSDNPLTVADAKAKYLCEPGERFDRPGHLERIRGCVTSRLPIAELNATEYLLRGMRMRTLEVVKYNTHRQPDAFKYVARIDLGKTRDRAACCVAHLNGGKVIVDLLAHWVPDERTGLIVDIDDPANLVIKLKKELCNIVYVTYDRWNSSSSINRLNKKRIVSEQLSLGPREYSLMFSTLYSGGVDLLDMKALLDPTFGELAHLVIDKETGKVDHEEGFHNDLTEALCGVIAMLLGTKKNVDDIPAGLGNVTPNLHEVSNQPWSDGNIDPFESAQEDEDDLFPGEGISIHLP